MSATKNCTLLLNGEPYSSQATNLLELVMEFTHVTETATSDVPRGIAVAVNGTVVPRSQWQQTPLVDGQNIELVTAQAGG